MNSDRALRHEPKRHGIGQGWIWIRTGFDIFNKGMGASVAMIVLWFVVGIVLDRAAGGGLDLPVALHGVGGRPGWRWRGGVTMARRCNFATSLPVSAIG